MRVLIIKTSSLGDVIHVLPALTEAMLAIPGIRFDWVVEEGFAELPTWHPAVDKVIPVAIRRWRKHIWWTIKSGEWQSFKKSIQSTKYDLVIDAQGLLKSAWLTRYVSAPVAGFDKDSAREPIAACFYSRRLAVPPTQHAVERLRQLFAAALGYNLADGSGNYGLSVHKLYSLTPKKPFVLLLHGSTWDTKRWPEIYWRELAKHLADHGVDVKLPWGNAVEKVRAERLAIGLENAEVLPKLNLGGVARVLTGALACVAVDTGFGHLAAALNVPTISLFSSTNPILTGTYGKRQIHLSSDFPCAPCLQKHCTYQPTYDDLRLFDMKLELPLCFTRLSPAHVASRLSMLLFTDGLK
ncbi:lipopolysaccharide heptosyltransferase I [Candidatus Pseudomonas adelgestsugas]|uniref:Lipopolysaccharide heptosyltransferase 1 n=1 Tax=Candidatus Pseudomonas adelgestsugas TaxID=1302376 RepID=A0ABX5R7Z7_9PSED|nr:lipopolysaccharide heptosyltransferase I [Candidatus Pseudomonas adelgestsugas]QAX81562.1 Lipopolysaccharide heptosyltransferase 1 [Candidatus Pseudomonas adelgestsugas]